MILVAAARDAHEAHVLDVAVHRAFAEDAEDDRAFELIERHAVLQLVEALFEFRDGTLWPQALM